MADPSLNTNTSTFTSSSLKDENGEVMVPQEPLLRRRAYMKNLPQIDEADSKYKEIIYALPKEQGYWLTSMIRKYKGFWHNERVLPGILAMEEAFKPCPDDVIVVSLPKSGTTWLKALTFTIVHRNKYDFSSHPFLKLNPHDCVPFMDAQYAMRDEQYLETLPSPRVLGTHMPYSLLPKNVKESKCPILYICREPKDIVVSLWHMVKKIRVEIPFSEVFELFCKGQTPCGPFWDHVLEYYRESLHNTNKILILKYEEMMNDPVDAVLKIASFVGCPFSEEEVKLGAVKETVDFCSFNKLKDLDANKNERGNHGNDIFFRKAAVGDWQNYLTPEMAGKLDKIIKEKFCHSGFTYGVRSTVDQQA